MHTGGEPQASRLIPSYCNRSQVEAKGRQGTTRAGGRGQSAFSGVTFHTLVRCEHMCCLEWCKTFGWMYIFDGKT